MVNLENVLIWSILKSIILLTSYAIIISLKDIDLKSI